MSQSERIIICSNAYPPNFIGGAELIAHQQAKAFKRMGHDVVIFAGDPHLGGTRHRMIEDTFDGLTVYRVHLTPEDCSPDFINFHHRDIEIHFQKVLDEFLPSAVHFHNVIGLSLGLVRLAKKKGAVTILTVHDHWGFCHKNTIMKQEHEICGDFSRCWECMPFIHDGNDRRIPIRMRQDYLSLSLEEVDAFVSPSRYLADQYMRAGIGQGKFSVIWNGIDVRRFEQIERSPDGPGVRFTFLGYFGRHKGVHTLLEALACLADKSLVKVNLVGEGEQMPHYRRMIARAGLERAVRVWGKTDNRRIEEVYRETDVLVLPSIWPENQPVSITEAMAARIPVIASRMGGVPELVEDGKTGYLFEAGDAQDLAQKMTEFVKQPGKLKTFGEQAHHAMKDRPFDAQAGQLLHLYEQARNANPPRREETLVICIGGRVDAECAKAIDAVSAHPDGNTFRFVMSDWLEADQIRDAAMLWVVGGKIKAENTSALMRLGIPLVVPDKNRSLKKICRAAHCGLYYRNADEAEACVRYLAHHESVARAMGRNASLAMS